MTIFDSANFITDFDSVVVEIGVAVSHKRLTTPTYDVGKLYQNPESTAYDFENAITVVFGSLEKAMKIYPVGIHDDITHVITVKSSVDIQTDDFIVYGAAWYRVVNVFENRMQDDVLSKTAMLNEAR